VVCGTRSRRRTRYGISADTALCLGALHDAVWERFPDQLERLADVELQLSHDWGSQFTSRRYQAELRTLDIRSRPTMIGPPEQNGIKERFFAALKDEEVWPKEYETRAEAIEAIDAWIDFYRNERPHQSLDYLTPAEFRTAAAGSTRARDAA
jgi:putative transposase